MTNEELRERYNDKIKQINEINRRNREVVNISLHKEYDADILEILRSKDNKTKYIKGLIRNDIK